MGAAPWAPSLCQPGLYLPLCSLPPAKPFKASRPFPEAPILKQQVPDSSGIFPPWNVSEPSSTCLPSTLSPLVLCHTHLWVSSDLAPWLRSRICVFVFFFPMAQALELLSLFARRGSSFKSPVLFLNYVWHKDASKRKIRQENLVDFTGEVKKSKLASHFPKPRPYFFPWPHSQLLTKVHFSCALRDRQRCLPAQHILST